MPTLEEIKAKQQVTWSSGDYGKIAWITQPLAEVLADALDVRPGAELLDVATGTGHVALAAARRFVRSTGVDYVPALLEVGRRRAASEGLDVAFTEGDVENIPFPDASFDYVVSTLGAMFAPNQEKTASEILRVVRPGGTVGMINWRPEGFIGELFRTIGKHVPPPEGLKPAALWGSEDRVRELFGEDVSELGFKDGAIRITFLSPEHFADFFITNYGPTLKASEALEGERREAFRKDLVELAARHNTRTDGPAALDWTYLLVIATKA
ncbi:MAG: class I SAM-dependent methyltransferase [Actinomycetota bacterium]